MPRDTLTGSRIRERRVAIGVKQADLARRAGISASYLNLIEHNRRRIGGKLLLDIAAVLDVEPTMLTEGAGAALIATLRETASELGGAAELDRVDEFAGRFPGWAQLLADCRARIVTLERSVETLTDRMTHDPHLAASLHEMLSTVTAIHSTASILAEPGEIDPDWQTRFHRNIHEDSARLAETSRGLVTYLEADEADATRTGTPQEELDAALEATGHHVPELETASGSVDAAMERLGQDASQSAQGLLRDWLTRYAADARALPLDLVETPLRRHGPDPVALAHALDADPARVMRRLATLPPDLLPEPVGLAICDASGTLRYRKPLPDFPMPRFGAACPLWPLYHALNRPGVLLSLPVQQPGRTGPGLWAEALAVPRGRIAVNDEAIYEAQMLVRPHPLVSETPVPRPVGVACRVCPREACAARSEPSILAPAG